MKIKRSKLASLALAALLLTSSIVTQAQETKQTQVAKLSLAEAVKSAKQQSATLAQNSRLRNRLDRAVDYQTAQIDAQYETALDLAQEGDNSALQALEGMASSLQLSDQSQYATKRYVQMQTQVIETGIERSIRQLFDGILYNQEKLSLLEEKIELTERLVQAMQIKYDNGMASLLELEKQQVSYKQLVEEKENLKKTIDNQYTQLANDTGRSKLAYSLEKEDNTYKAYNFPGSLDALVNLRAKDHLDLWKVKADVDTARLAANTKDYYDGKEDIEQAKDNVDLTYQALKEKLAASYTSLQVLEQNYDLAKKSLELQENQLKKAEINLKLENIAPIEYDQLMMSYKENQLALKQLVNQHNDLAELINKPYLISASSQY